MPLQKSPWTSLQAFNWGGGLPNHLGAVLDYCSVIVPVPGLNTPTHGHNSRSITVNHKHVLSPLQSLQQCTVDCFSVVRRFSPSSVVTLRFL